MPGVNVDGNDVEAMYAVASEAVKRAREGGGPTLIEAMTYRFHGHVMGDADGYMDKREKEAAIAADPVPRYRTTLLNTGIATEEWLAGTERAIEKDIDEAVEFAFASPYPELTELTRDVFHEETAT
jgi:acetoin:2,6-dichlorophenolindophenol oxidoreductase subunit alpha